MHLLSLYFDCSHKALDSSEEGFDFDIISWLVTSATAQNLSAAPGELQKHLEETRKPKRSLLS